MTDFLAHKPKVSVVITCYNYGHYVEGCLDSVFKQTFDDFEVILVDDGSTDDTVDRVKPYSERDSRFRYLRTTNGGQASAKNTGIYHSRGEFVAFLDADDLWHPEKLMKQMSLFQDDAVGIVYSLMEFINEKGEMLPSGPPSKYLTPRSGWITDYLLFDNFIPFSTSVVRRECLENHGVFDEGLAMGIDWDLWLRLSPHYRFAFVDEPLMRYRVGHAGQMSKKLEVRQKCSDLIFSRFVEANSDRLEPQLIRKARSYTHCSRGYYFRKIKPLVSARHYLSALRYDWANSGALVGLAKVMGLQTLKCLGLRNS